MKVLVIDMDEEWRERVVDALRELTNFSILAAVGGVEAALRVLEAETPDVVVTAEEFADGDCLDVIEAARRGEPSPAIVLFAHSDVPSQARRAIAAGADLCLVRRAGVGELQRAVLDVTRRLRGPRRHSGLDRFTLLGRLAAGVAHDVNNYLTVVDASLAIAERAPGGATARADLVRARRAIESATQLTRSVLEYARGGAPAPEAVELSALVRRVLDLFGRAIPSDVRVSVELAADLPPVRGIAIELEQLLLNLVLNACDAMPHGGDLLLAVGHDGPGLLRLEVADTGHGLSDDVAGADDAVTPSDKAGRAGAGLGLGIVRSVADRHGADLRIVPRAGGGTRVVIVVAADAR